MRNKVILPGALLLFILLSFAFHSLLSANIPGADFFTFHLAGRAALLEGGNPYSPELTLQSQLGILGRPALPGEDQLAFAYPPYILLPLAPLIALPFDWAQAVWLAFNLTALVTAALLLFPRAPLWLGFSLLFFYPLAFGLLLGNFAIPIGILYLAFYALALRQEPPGVPAQALLGVALAWTTAKPQFVWLHLFFCLLLAFRLRLRPFLIAFLCGAAALFGLAFVLVPGWLTQWLGQVTAYAGYTSGGSTTLTTFLALLLPADWALGVTLFLLLIALAATAWLLRRWWRSEISTLFIIGWVGLVTFLFHLHPIAYDQFVFLIPFILWAAASRPSRRVLVWWLGALLFSWVAFSAGLTWKPADLLPALWFTIWVFSEATRAPSPAVNKPRLT